MKTILCSLILSIVCFVSFGQVSISPNEWQQDLRFLQQTVHDQYSFLFKKLESAKFDTEVEKLYDAIPKLEEHEIIVGLARIVSLFEYGHTSINLHAWREREAFQFHQLPYNLYQFSDGIYVQGAKKEYQKAVGARVLKVEGVDIQEVLNTVKPVFPSENDQFFKAYGLHYLGIPEILHAQGISKSFQKSITLTLEKNGEIFDQKFLAFMSKSFPGSYGYIHGEEGWLDARDITIDPYYLKNLERIYYYEYLPEYKTVYVRHSQIQDDEEKSIPEFYEEVFEFIETNDVEKLVLDVRLNGGGNNYKNKPIITGIIRTEKINKVGKLFVIIGRKTFSACQNLVNELDNYTEAIFVGEPTGENINFYGDNRQVILPNSQIPVRLSYAWWQDKPQWENEPWTVPHIAIDLNFKDYKTNKDPVLEAALSFSENHFILDPMSYLTNLYMSGELEKLQAEAVKMVNNPLYKFFDFESEFNTVGYNLLGNGQPETAVAVFQLILQLFPGSANAWDSLAEGYWKAGQIDKAIEHYEKAISMDPTGQVGENARNMLLKIKQAKE